MVQDLDERVLREVFGDGAVAHHAEHEREHGSLVPAQQLPVRGFAPTLRERNHVRIGKIGQVEQLGHGVPRAGAPKAN